MINRINNIYPGELSPDKIFAGAIDVFENVWPNPEETISMIENEISSSDSMSWSKAQTIGSGIYQDRRTNYDISITHFADLNNSVAQAIHNQFYLLLLAATIPYAKKHDIDLMYHEGYNMLRYRSNQSYGKHSDGGTGTGRSISAICYLNDNFSGGEIEFVNFGINIRPTPGTLILFPSNYAYSHVAHPVTEGTKYALVTWIKDREI